MSKRWPDLAVLELLLAVAEHGSLGAAARAVGMAQPNASRLLAGFERDVGLRILHRSPRGSVLTAEGAIIADWAYPVLRAAGEMNDGVAALQEKRNSSLTVGASLTVAEHLVPGWLAELRRAQPQLKIRLRAYNSAEVCKSVAAGQVDVGFVESPEVPAELYFTDVGADRLVIVVSPRHPWARRREPVSAEELAAVPLLVREPGSGTRTTLEAALAGLQMAEPALELSSNAVLRAAVATGVAPAALSWLTVAAEVNAGALNVVPVAGLDLTRRLRAVWRAPERLCGPALELVRIARASLPAAGK